MDRNHGRGGKNGISGTGHDGIAAKISLHDIPEDAPFQGTALVFRRFVVQQDATGRAIQVVILI